VTREPELEKEIEVERRETEYASFDEDAYEALLKRCKPRLLRYPLGESPLERGLPSIYG
jgi:hypothetical protein